MLEIRIIKNEISIVYSRVGGNIVSFPMQYISHEKHKYAPICTPWDIQFAMRIFINRTSLSPLPTATTWVKENTHRVGTFEPGFWYFSSSSPFVLYLFRVFCLLHFCFLFLIHTHKYCCIFSSTHFSSCYFMLHIFSYIFPLILFSLRYTCVLRITHVLYNSLSLFVSLSLFRFLFLVRLFFMRVFLVPISFSLILLWFFRWRHDVLLYISIIETLDGLSSAVAHVIHCNYRI